MGTALETWVDEVSRMTRPKDIVWCDGSQKENERLVEGMLRNGTLHELNPREFPGCFLHRSDPRDVARTEHLTFVCTTRKEDAGPNNNWMSPAEARAKLTVLFDGSMRDRTMYVVPYLLGPAGSPFAKVGVELTDSPYVVASMRIMTRMGQPALDQMARSGEFAAGLHSLGDLDPERRFIVHFPEERLIWSVGSGYGGNALLGKKCFALRIASRMARDEGWMAEHMLILGLEDPAGQVTYMAAAFPSACGKTNLAMLVSPLEELGYRVWTVGDDIAWIRPGPDGRLWATNPEAGFFGVAPGTGPQTNPNAMETIRRHSIFTNVALTPQRTPWWEGMSDGHPPAGLLDWQGRPWSADGGPAAHPNSRFTTPARQCPSISPHWEDPQGVPISAFIFGGRRSRVAPLVFQAYDWPHSVFVAATMASETTAAATGKVGVTRRDPMAMLPFCGYNMADYFGHWLAMADRVRNLPLVFHVNWFRRDAGGKFLWPGFGQNIRVLMWILDRIRGKGKGVETPLGYVPSSDALYLDGLDLSADALHQLLEVDRDTWRAEWQEQKEFFNQFGDRLPVEILRQHDALAARLNKVQG